MDVIASIKTDYSSTISGKDTFTTSPGVTIKVEAEYSSDSTNEEPPRPATTNRRKRDSQNRCSFSIDSLLSKKSSSMSPASHLNGQKFGSENITVDSARKLETVDCCRLSSTTIITDRNPEEKFEKTLRNFSEEDEIHRHHKEVLYNLQYPSLVHPLLHRTLFPLFGNPLYAPLPLTGFNTTAAGAYGHILTPSPRSNLPTPPLPPPSNDPSAVLKHLQELVESKYLSSSVPKSL